MKTRNTVQTIADNVFTMMTGEFIEGVMDMNSMWAPTYDRFLKKLVEDVIDDEKCPPLSQEQEEAIQRFYRRYTRVDTFFHRFYTGMTGKFCPEYIPDNLYGNVIERFYTDIDGARYIDNKCYYYSFFPDIKHPEAIAMRIGSIWVDDKYRLITYEKALELMDGEECLVVKRAVNSEGGAGVFFLDNDGSGLSDKADKLIKTLPYDLVVQRRVVQHKDMAALHPQSVNSIRILSMERSEGVYFIFASVRIGSGGNRVDNACQGGFFLPIGEDGVTKGRGCARVGKAMYTHHPTLGYELEGIKIPGFENAKELVRRGHGVMSHFRLITWDIAIDSVGDAVLIETNLCMGSITELQLAGGPLFGDRTREILDEVFYLKNGKKRDPLDAVFASKNWHTVKDNALAVATGYYSARDTRIKKLSNPALRQVLRGFNAKVREMYPPLTREEEEQVKAYYGRYVKNVYLDSHRIYKGKSGRFCVEYLPEDMYMCDIDRYLSDRDMAYYFENKCYFPRLFSMVKQADTLVMRIGRFWLDKDYRVISGREVLDILEKEEEFVIKSAQFSEGGESIVFMKPCPDRREFKIAFLKKVRDMGDVDVIVQRPVSQHEELSRLHAGSLNTFRIISLLIDDEVVILSTSLKIGTGSARIDNGCKGGIYCGVRDDGYLGPIGALDNGEVIRTHPDTGISFETVRITVADRARDLVKKAHPIMGHNRLISWDVAVDEEGDAVLIEANLSFGGSDDVQVVNGPFFGKYTERILNEVYGKNAEK